MYEREGDRGLWGGRERGREGEGERQKETQGLAIPARVLACMWGGPLVYVPFILQNGTPISSHRTKYKNFLVIFSVSLHAKGQLYAPKLPGGHSIAALLV